MILGTFVVSGQVRLGSLHGPAYLLYTQKSISDADEYHAYMNALNEADVEKRALAMLSFVVLYPKSKLKIDALEQAMSAYQKAGNVGGLMDMSGRILVLDRNHVRALAVRLAVLRGEAAQGKSEWRPEQFIEESRRGLQALKKWKKPKDIPDEEFIRVHNQMSWIFHGAAAFGFLRSRNFSAARDSYVKALEVYPQDEEDVVQIGIAELELNPVDVNGFWYIAKAGSLAPRIKQGIEAYGRCKYISYHGAEDGWEQIESQSAGQTKPPAGFDITAGPQTGTTCKFEHGPRSGLT